MSPDGAGRPTPRPAARFRRLLAWHPRLKARIGLFILLAGLISGAVMLGFIYVIGTGTLKSTIGRSFQELASTTASNVDTLFAHHIEEARLLASAHSVLSLVEESNAFYGTDPPEDVLRRIAEIDERWRNAQGVDAFSLEIRGNRATAYLQDFAAQTPDPTLFQSILVTNAYGALVAAVGDPRGYAYGETAWWRQSFHGGQGQLFVGGVEHDPERGADVLVIATPIFQGKRAVGVLSMIHSADLLLRGVTSAKIGKTDHTMIVTQDGRVVFCPAAPADRHTLSPDLIATVTKADKGWAATTHDAHFTGREALNGHAPIPMTQTLGRENFGGRGWYVFTSQNPAESYAPVYTLLRWTAVAGLAGTIVFSLLGLLIARRIVRPIQALQTGAELIGQGNLNHRIEITTGDEIEELARQFNKMAHKLKLFYIGLEENVKEKNWKLEHQNKELSILYSIAATLNQALPLKDLLDETLKKMLDVMEADGGMIWMAQPPQGSSPITATKLPALSSGQMSSLIELIHYISLAVKENSEVWAAENLAVDGRLDHLRSSDPGFISLAGIPLTSRDHVLGILFLLYRDIRALTSREEKLLGSVGSQIGVTIEHAAQALETRAPVPGSREP
ncbi:MAG: cache domain-containing protein [Nitrospiria bacterium]